MDWAWMIKFHGRSLNYTRPLRKMDVAIANVAHSLEPSQGFRFSGQLKSSRAASKLHGMWCHPTIRGESY